MKFPATFKSAIKFDQAWAIGMALCFGMMTLFSPLLHNHDWDPFHAESDCAPCNWSQSNVSLEVQAPDISTHSRIIIWRLPSPGTTLARFLQTRKSRSPPTFR